MGYIKNLMRENKEVGFFDCMLLRRILKIKLNKAREEGYKKGRDKIDRSTPEQKEEWEEGFNRYWGCMFECGDYEKLIGDIKNLLSEREREVLNSMREWVVEYHKDNWDIRDFDAEIAIGKIIDRELDKLK